MVSEIKEFSSMGDSKKRFKKWNNKPKNSFNESKFCCYMSSYPPRECGIATFTKDLSTAMNIRFNPKLKSKVIALQEDDSFYHYNNKVLAKLERSDIAEYIKIAKKINVNNQIKIVNIQHEFGLFGGEYGGYIVPFLETLEKPVVVTFHTVLPNPDKIRRKIIKYIGERSSGLIVMTNSAVEILKKDYGIDENKIHVVYHGIPNVGFKSNIEFKKRLRLENKTVLTTFGLLSRGKGVEYTIKSLPPLIKKYPNLLYLVVGETHPVVREEEGETYRKELKKLVQELGLKNHVRFYNKYLTLQEITEHIQASDVYLCTNLEKAQISSGTLSYAQGCGRVVISTPIAYANEVLAQEKGIVLSQTKAPHLFTEAIDKILSNSELKSRIEKNAYTFSRQMIWSNVAARYLRIFNNAVQLREETTEKYPKIKLNHLFKMTDNYGMFQFSNSSIPDKNAGYTLDDNARALIAATMHKTIIGGSLTDNLIKTYLNFIEISQKEDGWFNNLHKESINNPLIQKIINESQDAFGRTIWALGHLIRFTENDQLREKAKKIFDKSYKNIEKLEHLRSKAFSVKGLYDHYKKFPVPKVLGLIKEIANHIVEKYESEKSESWNWFESKVTYSNSSICEALFLAYDLTKEEKYLEVAEKTLGFLTNVLFTNNHLSLIGEKGWYTRNGNRALFDEQPIDAGITVGTYLRAYEITKKEFYNNKAILAFNWFLGKNYLNQMMYDERSGGCHDGLSKTSINLNQGAESLIAYLIARLYLEKTKKNKKNII